MADPNLIYYNDIHMGFQVARADNGYIFKEYDAIGDRLRLKVAKDEEELAAFVEDWSSQIALAIRKGLLRKAKPDG